MQETSPLVSQNGKHSPSLHCPLQEMNIVLFIVHASTDSIPCYGMYIKGHNHKSQRGIVINSHIKSDLYDVQNFYLTEKLTYISMHFEPSAFFAGGGHVALLPVQ